MQSTHPTPSSSPALPTALPTSVAWLGYGGLLPFAALAGIGWWAPGTPLWGTALLAYGAVILSFVGALHWGFAMVLPGLGAAQRQGLWLWSVVPALLAWPAVLWAAPGAALLLVAGFAAHWLRDWRLVAQTGAALPPWYLGLRTRLTLVACLCLLVGAGALVRAGA